MERRWLIEIRAQKGKTQTEVAKEAGISRSYLTRIEGGDFKLPVNTAMKIANALGFDWAEFYEEYSIK